MTRKNTTITIQSLLALSRALRMRAYCGRDGMLGPCKGCSDVLRCAEAGACLRYDGPDLRAPRQNRLTDMNVRAA